VYPYDTTGDPNESRPASRPWFQMSFSPVLGQLPFKTDLYSWLGVNTTLVQGPLPQGTGSSGELPGTSRWVTTVPAQSSSRSTLGLMDMAQGNADLVGNGVNAVGDEVYPNFWPGLSRINVALKMEDATISFGSPIIWG
jgi:hypothetical protein